MQIFLIHTRNLLKDSLLNLTREILGVHKVKVFFDNFRYIFEFFLMKISQNWQMAKSMKACQVFHIRVLATSILERKIVTNFIGDI